MIHIFPRKIPQFASVDEKKTQQKNTYHKLPGTTAVLRSQVPTSALPRITIQATRIHRTSIVRVASESLSEPLEALDRPCRGLWTALAPTGASASRSLSHMRWLATTTPEATAESKMQKANTCGGMHIVFPCWDNNGWGCTSSGGWTNL